MKWTKLIISVNPVAVEALAGGAIMELGIEGVEIDDGILSDSEKEAMFVNYVDASIVPHEEHRVIIYLDEEQNVNEIRMNVEKALETIKDFLDIGSANITIEEMPDEDYENKWKEFYSSFRIGEHMLIAPIWEEVYGEADDIIIKIDPGMAFGSGTHETTSMCVEALIDLDLTSKVVADVGCGSGILGIAAAKLGASKVIGIDIDVNAVTIAKENIVTNNVDTVMSIKEGNLLDQIDDNVDIVLANIMADVIIMIADDVKKALVSGGVFIASGGIILDKIQETESKLKDAGFIDVKVIKKR